MNDHRIPQIPAALGGIRRDTEGIGFALASEPKTGSLLRALAASKPGGKFLEIGTGTGVGTAWLSPAWTLILDSPRLIAIPRY